jgi:hypothetical protein
MNPKKIGFTFFRFFCDFLRNLQVSAKTQVLFRNHFALRSLETSGSYKNTLDFAVRPLELKRVSQCDPRRPAGAAPAEIRRPAALGCGGKGGRSLVAHLGVVLVGRMGRWEARWGSSAAPSAGHRGGGKFRRGRGGFGQCAVGAASTGSQGGAGTAGRRQKEREGALTEQPSWRLAAA